MAAPTIQSAAVKNTKIELTFDTDLQCKPAKVWPAASDFSLSVNGETLAVHHLQVKNNVVKLFVSGTDKIAGDKAVTVSYTDPTADDDSMALQGADGTDVLTFSNFEVTNIGKVKPSKVQAKLITFDDDASAHQVSVIGVSDTAISMF